MSEIEFLEGNHQRGIELMRQSVALSEAIGFSWWTAVSLASGAERLLLLDRLEEAEQWARVALPAIGERQFLLLALAAIARVAAQTDRAEHACALWEQSRQRRLSVRSGSGRLSAPHTRPPSSRRAVRTSKGAAATVAS